jgi:hypothetical protein
MKKGSWIAVAVLGLVGFWMWPADKDGAGSYLLYNRIWVSEMPSAETDVIDVLMVDLEQETAVFRTTSEWRGDFDTIAFRRANDKLDYVVMQDGKKGSLRWSVSKNCRPEFDYCLTLHGAPRGPTLYLSRHGWETGTNVKELPAWVTRP